MTIIPAALSTRPSTWSLFNCGEKGRAPVQSAMKARGTADSADAADLFLPGLEQSTGELDITADRRTLTTVVTPLKVGQKSSLSHADTSKKLHARHYALNAFAHEAPGPVGDVIARVALHSSGRTRNYPDRSDERTGTEITRPVPDGGLIQNHDVEEQGACLQAGPVHPASPWKVPRAGPSRDLGRQAMEILAARNARSPETGSGVMIHMDMRKAVLVHEFPMNTFGSIAFHGFLSTAETFSDKFLGHEDRLLTPQRMAHLELDLSSESHRKLLPKYAFCVIPERPESLGYPESTDYPLSYGNVNAVMRREVHQRSSWSYGDSLSLYAMGPRSRAHTFNEAALRRDMVQSAHFIEAQVWGELTLEDVDHFVLPNWMYRDIERTREYVKTGQIDGHPISYPVAEGYLESAHQQIKDFENFLDSCRLLKIPVYIGEINKLLTRTHDRNEGAVSPAFTEDRVLIPGLPADQRPPIDQARLISILGRPGDQSGSRKLLPEGLFKPGTSQEEQARAFADFQEAARLEAGEIE